MYSDEEIEFMPYKVVSNWPTTQDAWQLARRKASSYGEAKVHLESWKSNRLVPGTTLGAVPSFTTTRLRDLGLTDRHPSILLVDNQFLIFDNSNSGKKPQRQFGDEFQKRFRFLNLIRILMSLALGGSLELVLSAETSEDLEAAIQLGVQEGLLYSQSTRLGMNSLSSSKITCKPAILPIMYQIKLKVCLVKLFGPGTPLSARFLSFPMLLPSACIGAHPSCHLPAKILMSQSSRRWYLHFRRRIWFLASFLSASYSLRSQSLALAHLSGSKMCQNGPPQHEYKICQSLSLRKKMICFTVTYRDI